MDNYQRYSSALEDFRLARRQAALQDVMARISGKSQRLLSFEEVRESLGLKEGQVRGLQEINLEAIVGSVDRYQDFTRNFLPKQKGQQERWARIRLLAEKGTLPPIELYQLGKVYFVLDGHHRVSVARSLGRKTIHAYVTDIPTKATFSPEDDADKLILKAEELRFMKDTQLDQSMPDMRLELTSASGYKELREHIAVHQYYLVMQQKKEVSIQDAAANWMDKVYGEAIGVIRRKGLLRDFPDRSEGDLYLWLMEYRRELNQETGWELEPEEAAEDLQARFSLRLPKIIDRAKQLMIKSLTPETLTSGPLPGKWSQNRDIKNTSKRLFRQILVTVSGEERSWRALDQAIHIANLEGSQLRGLHIVRPDDNTEKLKIVQEKFQERVNAAKIEGKLVVEEGQVRKRIERRSRWSDLAVLHMLHPPGSRPAERLRSGLRELIQRIPRPLLLVPKFSEMQHALLAYDGSRKATEALYIAAYLQKSWGINLTIVTSQEENLGKANEIQFAAKHYLKKRGITATYEIKKGKAGESILETAKERGSDFVLMGGYGASPLVEMVIGSAVDLVLREFKGPVLICR